MLYAILKYLKCREMKKVKAELSEIAKGLPSVVWHLGEFTKHLTKLDGSDTSLVEYTLYFSFESKTTSSRGKDIVGRKELSYCGEKGFRPLVKMLKSDLAAAS